LNLRKLLIIGLSLIIILISSITLLIEIIYPPHRIKSFVLDEISRQTNRKVTIDEVGFTIWGGLGVEVNRVVISDRPSFSDNGPFILLDRFILRVQIWPLLNRELVIDELVFDQPEISILFGPDGTANFSDLMLSDTTSVSTPSSVEPSNPPLSIELSSIRIENGVIRYFDAQSDLHLELRDIDNQLALSLDPSSLLTVDGNLLVNEFMLQGPAGDVNWRFQLSYRSEIDPTTQTMTIESIGIQLVEFNLQLAGKIMAYDTERPIMDLTFVSKDLSIEKSLASLPPELLTNIAEYNGEGSLTIDGNVQGPFGPGSMPDLYAQINLADGRLETPELPVPFTNLSAHIEIKNNRAELHSFSAQAGLSDFSLSGGYENLFGKDPARPSINFEMHAVNLNLDELLPPVEDDAPVPFEALPDLTIRGQGTFDKVIYQGLELTDTKFSVSIEDQKIFISNLSADAYGGQLTGSISQDLTDLIHPQIGIDIKINEVKADAILSPLLPVKDILTGSISTNVSGFSELDSIGNPIINALSLLGALSIDRGQISNWPPLQELASWINIPEVKSIDFDQLTGGIQIKDGRIQSDHLQLIGPSTEWIASGSSGIDGSMDYQVQLTLSDMISNKLGNAFPGNSLAMFKDQIGRMGVHFRLGGTITDPSFSWNTSAVKKQVKERVGGLAKTLIAENKNNILGQSSLSTTDTDSLKQQATAVIDSLKSEMSGVKDEAKSRIKSLFKRN